MQQADISKTATRTSLFAEKADEKIIISRRDMSAALYMGDHYDYNFKANQQTFLSDTINVTLTAPRAECHRARNQTRQPDYHIKCTLRDTITEEIIDLDFKQRGHELEFIKGKISDEQGKKPATPITSAGQLGDALGRIYQAVRGDVDKKWAADIAMAREAREIAGQRLHDKMESVPHFVMSKGRGFTVMHFIQPDQRQPSLCQNKCGKCSLKA